MNQDEIINENCENNPKIMEAVKVLLTEIGEDPNREGLQRTPLRIARAYKEWFGGYGKDPKEVLNRTFPSEGYDDLIVIKDIAFTSHCEHHVAPFEGYAHIGLIAGDRIAGLDKYVKLVDIFAKRLQTQEVMTHQIGNAIVDVLKPVGVIVIIEGRHDCVGSRETKNKTTKFITTFRHGTFKEEEHLENRFLKYIQGGSLE